MFRPNGKMVSPQKENVVQATSKSKHYTEQNIEFNGSEEIWLGFSAKPESQAYENVTQILTEAKLDLSKNDILPQETLSKTVCFLMQQIERYLSAMVERKLLEFDMKVIC